MLSIAFKHYTRKAKYVLQLQCKGSSIIFIIYTSVQTVRWGGGEGGRTRRTLFQIIENDDRSTECESTGGLNFARQKLLLALLAFSPTQWLTQLTISMSCFYLLALSPVQCIENVFLWSLSLSWLTIKRWSAPSGALWSLHPTHPGIVMSLLLCLYHEYGTLSYDHHFFTHGLYTFRGEGGGGVLKRVLSVRSCKWWKWWTTPKSYTKGLLSFQIRESCREV